MSYGCKYVRDRFRYYDTFYHSDIPEIEEKRHKLMLKCNELVVKSNKLIDRAEVCYCGGMNPGHNPQGDRLLTEGKVIREKARKLWIEGIERLEKETRR